MIAFFFLTIFSIVSLSFLSLSLRVLLYLLLGVLESAYLTLSFNGYVLFAVAAAADVAVHECNACRIGVGTICARSLSFWPLQAFVIFFFVCFIFWFFGSLFNFDVNQTGTNES